ncbi:MAG TPA: four helix bundle protein [Verrucomicrobiota bacterium]|nr:four helix bundle protein [Verrucomicrobiota bacterium]
MTARTKRSALELIQASEKALPDAASKVMWRPLLRAGTSAGANHRAACRARSPADFISRISVVEEEADESGYGLERLMKSGRLASATGEQLHREAGELTASRVASASTAHGGPRRG